jgi:diguanylate cyclase (GGDEF)-like protein
LKRYVEQAVENGEKDPLTGLKNRRGFLTLADYEVKRRNRIRYPLTVAMMDIDCFKMLNDTQGHDVGDKLLVEFSEALIASLRNVDIIGRMGGDEFALVLPNTNLEQTNLVLKRLFSHLQPMLRSFGCNGLGCSLGAVNVKSDTRGSEINELLKQADSLMYQIKHTSKNDFLVKEI